MRSGVQIDPANTKDVAAKLIELLTDQERWESIVQEQLREIEGYPDRHYEKKVLEVWEAHAPKPTIE